MIQEAPTVRPCLTPDRAEKRQNGPRFRDEGEDMFSLTGQDVHGVEIAPTIRSETNTADVHFIPEQIKVGNIYPSGGEQGDVFDPSGISRTLKSGETSNPDHGGIGSSNSPKIIAGSRIRRLTPMECERLQGFQDSWTARGIDDSGNEVEISDSQRYRQCGNAITCPVISHFGRELRRLR